MSWLYLLAGIGFYRCCEMSVLISKFLYKKWKAHKLGGSRNTL
jgi:hypothetical protein